MTRLAAIALLIALVAVGCASSDRTINLSEAEPATNKTSPELVSGRTALAAAQGTPHILWFWAPS